MPRVNRIKTDSPQPPQQPPQQRVKPVQARSRLKINDWMISESCETVLEEALTWVPAEAAALLDEQGRMVEVLYRTLREKGTQAAVTIRLRPAALAT